MPTAKELLDASAPAAVPARVGTAAQLLDPAFTGAAPEPQGGLMAAAKQVVGQTVKGVGQLGADYLPGVTQENALTRAGQGIVDANPTQVRSLEDIVDKPWMTVKEAVGNALPSVGGALGLRAAGQGITALAPLAGPAAPIVAGLGQAVSWGGPVVAAALPSYSGIRDAQLEEGKNDAASKLLSLGGAAAVGGIEMLGGPQARILKAMTGGLKREAGESVVKVIGKEGLKSALEEGAEELVQNPIEQVASYQNPATKENIKETLFGGAMGFIGGGVLGGGMQAVSGQKEKEPPPPEVEDAQSKMLAAVTNIDGAVVKNGRATIPVGEEQITVPVDKLAEHLSKGGTIDTIDTAAMTSDTLSMLQRAVQDERNPLTFDDLVNLRNDPAALQEAGVNRKDIDALVEAEIERAEDPGAAWIKQERLARQTNLANLERLQGLDARVQAAQTVQEKQDAQRAANAERQRIMDEQVRQYEETLQVPGRPLPTVGENAGQGLPVTEQESVLARTQPTQQQQRAERYAGLVDLFGNPEKVATAQSAQQTQQRSGPTPTAVSRLTELEQKAQGIPGASTPTSLTPLEEQEYLTLRAQASPADQQRVQEYQANVARRDALLRKQTGALALENVSEGGPTTIAPAVPAQTLTPKEQTELTQLIAATQRPPVSPYTDDSRTLAAGLPAAQSETRFSQAPETIAATAQQVNPQVKYDGPTMGDIHGFTLTLPDGRKPSFSVQGEVTPETFTAALNDVETRYKVPLTVSPQAANVQAVTATLDQEFGKGAVARLTRQGKLQIVASANEIPDGDKLSANQQQTARGVYKTETGKIYLVAGNLSKDNVSGVFKHEVVHALLRQDAAFMQRRGELISDFERLMGKDASVDAAVAQVPQATQGAVKTEEALAYWVQNDANHKHSLFRRMVAVVKAALLRLGIPVTSMTASDFSRLFAQGTEAFVNQGGQVEKTAEEVQGQQEESPVTDEEQTPSPQEADTLFSQASTTHQQARSNVTANLKEMANEKLTEASPFFLRVSPLRTLVQTLGKQIPQIARISNAFDEMSHTSTSMSEDALGNYKENQRVNKKATGNMEAFSKAATLASFYRMTPWKNLDEQEWVPSTFAGSRGDRLSVAQARWEEAGMDKASGKSFIAAWNEAAAAYRGLKTDEAKKQYQKMARHMRHIREREETNVLAAIERGTVGKPVLRAAMMERFNDTFRSIKGVYWPLTRWGEYTLEFMDLDGVKVRMQFPSIGGRRAFVNDMVKDGVDPQTIKTGYLAKTPRGQVAIPNELMQQFSQAIIAERTKGLDPDADADAFQAAAQEAQSTVDDLNQIWLRWQPETSALKSSLRRKNIKGYDLDAGRGYLEYVQRHAQKIAWTEQGRVIEDELKGMNDELRESRQKGENTDLKSMVLQDLRARVQAARDTHVGPIASLLGKFGTAYYMTSPSIALVQMTQLPMLTLPKLGVMYNSPGKAAKALTTAIKDSFSKKFSRDALYGDKDVNELHNASRLIVTDEMRQTLGETDRTLGARVYTEEEIAASFDKLNPQQQKLFVLREALARNLLDISAVHEAYAIAGGKNPDAVWRKAFDLAMTPMRVSEQASRKAAILATMDMAQKAGKGYEGIMADVHEVVHDTLYSYDKANKPAFLQGSTGRVLAMFQWYRIMTIFRMALLFKRSIRAESPEVKAAARKEFAGIMGMAGLLAGTMGMPMAGLIFAALDAGADDDEPRDSALEWRKMLQEGFGERLGDIAAYGLPAAVGMHLTKRIGMGDMFGMQSSPPPNMHGKDLAAWWAASQLGPAFSIGQSWVQGYDEAVNKGDVMRGLETAMPKPIKDAMKAYRVWSEGEMKTASGKRVLGPDQITPDMVPMLALGFNPLEAAKAGENRYSLANLGAGMSRRRGQLINAAADALEGDGDFDQARDRIVAFNQKNPQFRIESGEIRTALKRNRKNEMGMPSKRERGLSMTYGIPPVE